MSAQAPGQAERERFAARMEMLADWFDDDDFAKGRAGRTEVQEDLRRWAAAARDLAAKEPEPAPDLGAAHADLESEIRAAICCACCSPGVPCDLCLRETDRAMQAIDVYARDVAQHERTRPQPDPEPGTALCLSAIARLSAGLRDVRQACERGDGPLAVAPLAKAALADVDRLRLRQPEPPPETAPPEALDIAWNALQHIAVHGDDKSAAKARETLRAVNEYLEDGTTEDGIDRTPRIGTEYGPVALRPALSATVVIAAPDPIGEGPRATMTAAFAQDGLRAVFVENTTAIGELPPDPALRADLEAMAARWDDQAATHCQDAERAAISTLEAAALLAKARVYDANAAEVRETIGGEPRA